MRHEASLHIAARAFSPTDPAPSRGWRGGLVALWLAACGWLVAGRLDAIRTLRLPDGDDAMRLLQVRAWLAGQGWFDLRQYRLDPPAGADMHWSRLVDLPLAAVIAPLRPLIGPAAEAVAVAVVPLATLGAAMLLLALIARRLIAPGAWWWPPALLLLSGPPLGMMTPLRIDHHGWQIVLVQAMLLGLVTRDRRHGGIGAGLAIAASLAIGVEMLPCLAMGAGLAAIGWLVDAREGERLRALCIAAGAGTVVSLFAFVPPSARFGAACDALSLAYAAPLGVGCAVLAIGSGRSPARMARAGWIVAAGLAAGAAMLAAGGGVCLTDPYHAVDPAARVLWLDHVSEARPLWRQGAEVFLASLSLPLIGLAGAAMMMMMRAAPGERRAWAIVLALAGFALVLALASTRAAVAAMALALPGAAALGHHGRAWLAMRRGLAVRVIGSVALFLCVSAVAPRLLIAATLGEAASPNEAGAEACMAPAAIAALNALPAGTVLGFIDSTPALLLHTHHRGLAGPYHRNGRAIADAMRAWSGTDRVAEAIVRRHRIAWVVACGAPAEASLYDTRAPYGFHARLMRGDAPGWLRPVRVPNTPWRAWTVSRPLPGEAAGA